MLLVVVWLPSYFVLGNLNTWQLVINTATTIVTFLLVALLQNSQRRSGEAVHQKLDAIADGLANLMDHLSEDEDGLGGHGRPSSRCRGRATRLRWPSARRRTLPRRVIGDFLSEFVVNVLGGVIAGAVVLGIGYWLVDRRFRLKDRLDARADRERDEAQRRTVTLEALYDEICSNAGCLQSNLALLPKGGIVYPLFSLNATGLPSSRRST